MILVLLFVLVLVLVIVILLHVDSVLVLVIVSKISLSIAILFYALVYDNDDEDDAGLSSGAGMNLKVGGTCQTRSAGKFFVVPSTFLALQVQSVVLVSASVWPVQFDHFLVFCSFYSRCPRAQSFVKVWARAPVPWMESASLSRYSFTPESIIKQPFNLNA